MAKMRKSCEIEDDEFDTLNNQPVGQGCLDCGCQLQNRDTEIERLRDAHRNLNNILRDEADILAVDDEGFPTEKWLKCSGCAESVSVCLDAVDVKCSHCVNAERELSVICQK